MDRPRPRAWEFGPLRRRCSETPLLLRLPLLIASAPGWGSRSRRMPYEPLDTPDDLRKQALSQLAFGQLQDEVPSMSDEASAGLEEPLFQARERPALDGEQQDEPAQEIP